MHSGWLYTQENKSSFYAVCCIAILITTIGCPTAPRTIPLTHSPMHALIHSLTHSPFSAGESMSFYTEGNELCFHTKRATSVWSESTSSSTHVQSVIGELWLKNIVTKKVLSLPLSWSSNRIIIAVPYYNIIIHYCSGLIISDVYWYWMELGRYWLCWLPGTVKTKFGHSHCYKFGRWLLSHLQHKE